MNESETQMEDQLEVEIVSLNRAGENATDVPAIDISAAEISAGRADATANSTTHFAANPTANAAARDSTIDIAAVGVAELAGDDMAHASPAELLEQNRELMGWIAELERSLADCQTDFKAYLQQFQQQEDLLEARTAELNQAQSQLSTLTRELEAAQKSKQRQKILVETMTVQLENGQERIAQMERECTLAQRRCADQTQQLLQAESLCRDLKSRLSRQQRNTLQFKAALEKSLEVSVSPSNFDLPDLEVEPMDSLEDFFPRSKPVKPWSKVLDEADFVDLVISDAQEDDTELVIDNVEPVFDPHAAENLEARFKAGAEARGNHSQPTPTRVAFVPTIIPTAPIPHPAGFVAAAPIAAGPSQPESSAHGPDASDVSEVNDASEAAHLHLKTSEVKTPDVKTPEVKTPEVKTPEVKTPEVKTPGAKEPEVAAPGADAERIVSQANWPAPLVNPLRPSKKKIGSLAAIDLPNFPKAQV